MAFDLAAARADFPILEEKIHGKRLVYLDSGASAQKPVQVLDRMDYAYRHEYANVHRGLHTLANRATEAFEGAREKVRAFLNAARIEEIIFTRSTTEAINLVASSFAGPRIGEGDEIVISIAEHHSNIVPWHFHRERKGAVIKWVDVADDGSFDLDAFAAALTDRTKMVAITHMSNVLGTINPAKQIVEIAHARGIPVLVDGSQAAVHAKVDVQDIGADFYVFTGHKLYGPTGVGVLYGKYDLLAEMQRQGLSPNCNSFNSAISACGRAGELDTALELLSTGMRVAGVEPDVVSWSAAIAACQRRGEWRRALELLDGMRRQGVAPNERTFGASPLAARGAAHARLVMPRLP